MTVHRTGRGITGSPQFLKNTGKTGINCFFTVGIPDKIRAQINIPDFEQ